MTVAMQHPDIEVMATAVDEDQYLMVWRPRGWERLGAVEAFASDQLERLVRNIDELTVDELIELCAIRQAPEVARSAKKADHQKAYRATFLVVETDEVEAPDDAPVVDEKVATPASSK